MPNNIVHFEIYADDVDRARAFYESVLGWAFNHVESMDYTLVFPSGVIENGPAQVGINGGLVKRPGPGPSDDRAAPNAFVCTVTVDDMDAVVAKVEEHGGRVDMPPFDVEGVGRLAYVRDTEFNMIGLLKPLPRDGGV